MKKKIIYCLILVFIFSCNKNKYPLIPIENINKEYSACLASTEKNPSSIVIYVEGELDGSAALLLKDQYDSLYHQVYTFTDGEFNDTLLLDWYDTFCYFKYQPLNVKNGKLKIHYFF